MAVVSRKQLGNTHRLGSHLPLPVNLQFLSSVSCSTTAIFLFKDPCLLAAVAALINLKIKLSNLWYRPSIPKDIYEVQIKGKYLVEGTFWVIFFEPLYTFFQQIILYQIISYSSLVNSRSYINRFEVGKKHIIISNEEYHFV